MKMLVAPAAAIIQFCIKYETLIIWPNETQGTGSLFYLTNVFCYFLPLLHRVCFGSMGISVGQYDKRTDRKWQPILVI